LIALDPVKIDGRFRLCYGATLIIAYTGPQQPVDIFETVLDPAAATENRRVWVLQRRSADKEPGYANVGQARRAIQMIHEAGIEIVSIDREG